MRVRRPAAVDSRGERASGATHGEAGPPGGRGRRGGPEGGRSTRPPTERAPPLGSLVARFFFPSPSLGHPGDYTTTGFLSGAPGESVGALRRCLHYGDSLYAFIYALGQVRATASLAAFFSFALFFYLYFLFVFFFGRSRNTGQTLPREDMGGGLPSGRQVRLCVRERARARRWRLMNLACASSPSAGPGSPALDERALRRGSLTPRTRPAAHFREAVDGVHAKRCASSHATRVGRTPWKRCRPAARPSAGVFGCAHETRAPLRNRADSSAG